MTNKIKFWKGKKFTDNHKQNISNALKDKKFTDTHKQNISNALKGNKNLIKKLKGRHFTQKHKKNLRKSHLGKVHTDKTKLLLRERFLGKRSYWYGRKNTEQTERMIKNNPNDSLDVLKKKRILMILQLKKNGISYPCIGRNEKQILDELELSLRLKIIRQFEVCGYFTDGYCKDLNLVIEIDELPKTSQRELQREKVIIKELNCNFVRMEDY